MYSKIFHKNDKKIITLNLLEIRDKISKKRNNLIITYYRDILLLCV